MMNFTSFLLPIVVVVVVASSLPSGELEIVSEKVIQKRDLDNSGLIFETTVNAMTSGNPTCLNEEKCVRAACIGGSNINWYYREYFPAQNDTKYAYFNVSTIANTTFCNGSFVGTYAELVDEDDFSYVDRECQLYNGSVTFTFNGTVITKYLGPNATAYGVKSLWNGAAWSFLTLPLKPPKENNFYFYKFLLTYVDTTPQTAYWISNREYSPDRPFVHSPVSRSEVEAMINDQIVTKNNLTHVVCDT